MDKRIVYQRPDGGVSIVCPPAELFDPNSRTRKLLPKLNGKTPAEIWEWLLTNGRDVPPTAINPKIIHVSMIPQDRYFRDCWKQHEEGGHPVVDMKKAKEHHMNEIRVARDAHLARLDKDYTKFHGQKQIAAAQEVEDKRQRLRDLPKTFDLNKAATPQELKALWPSELPR